MGQLIINFKKKKQKMKDIASQRPFDSAKKSDNTPRTSSTKTPSQSAHRIPVFLPISDGKISPKEIICCGN